MKRYRLFLLLFLFAFGISSTFSQDDATSLNIETYELDNGLQVILVKDQSAPTVTVDVWYRVGGANDPVGRSGFAHLFEHMMFQGTANLDKEALQNLIEDAGGNFNAYTASDVTVYYEALPSHQLPLGLWLEADRMASLAVTQNNLDNQRAVVIEEYQQSYGNSPYGEAILELITIPFTYEPYQTAPIGSIEDLNAATLEEIRDFHSTYYVPNNATLTVAGDIDFEQTRELIDLFFAPIPRSDDPPTLPNYEPTSQAAAEIVTVQDDLINVPGVFIGYETPPRQHPDYAAVDILNLILSVGNASRLSAVLLDTGEALVADTTVLDNRGPSLFGVLLLPNFSSSTDAVEQIFYDELNRILEEGVADSELEKAINQIRSSQIASLETSFNLAEQVQVANYYFGSPDALFAETDRYTQVTSEDIQRVISEYLAPEDRHVIYVEPGDPVAKDDPDSFVGGTGVPEDDEFEVDFALDITSPPEPLDISIFNLPVITEVVLDNGLEVVVVEQPDLPVISLDLYLRGGESLVPSDRAGLSGIAASLLTRGTETRTAQEMALEIEQVGGFMGASASNDRIAAGVFALSKDTELAFEILGDAILHPIFPEKELAIQIEGSLTSLQAALTDPGALMGRTFNRLVYADHPYGNTVTEATIGEITRDAVVEYYQSVLHPENALFIIAGDISSEEGIVLAEATFGEWEGVGDPPVIDYLKPPTTEATSIYLVDVPGATQADVVIGNIGIVGSNPDRTSLQVMNNILGSGFNSRLFQNIREDKGYSYSIGSRFSFPVDYGTFRVVAAIRDDAVEDAVREILNELDIIRNEAIPEEDIEAMKAGMIGRYALQLETYQSFVNQIASSKLRGISLNSLATYPERVAAIDQDMILNVTQEYLPENYIIVVVGDASLIQESLEAIGEVTPLEAE